MNIMINYDNTYTADPIMWRNMLPRMKSVYNHNIYLVTSRDKDVPVEMENDFRLMNIPIIYCAWRAKRRVCEELGIKIDVWIDDDPHRIDTGFIEEHEKETFQNEPGTCNTVWHLAGGKAK